MSRANFMKDHWDFFAVLTLAVLAILIMLLDDKRRKKRK